MTTHKQYERAAARPQWVRSSVAAAATLALLGSTV